MGLAGLLDVFEYLPQLIEVGPGYGLAEGRDGVLAGQVLGGFQGFFGQLAHLRDGGAGAGHYQSGGEVQVRVAGGVAAEGLAHLAGKPQRAVPGADEVEVVAAGEHGIGARVCLAAHPGQGDGEEGVHLP